MNKMFKFNGMPYKRSGRAGGKSVSMIGMLVLLLAALLVLPSCFDDDTETTVEKVETIICNGMEVEDRNAPECQEDQADDYIDATGGTGDRAFMGSDDGDRLKGGDDADYIDGGLGDDSIKGMGGDDDIKGGEGHDTLYGGKGHDTLSGGDSDPGLDTIDGGPGDDTITGGPGADTITGGPGADTITGGPGADTIDGGEGSDTASYAGSMDGVQVTVNAQNILSYGDAFADNLSNIENLEGSDEADELTGDGGDNTLTGGAGDDTLKGGAGDDTLKGGAGGDTLDGGADNDTASYAGSDAGVTVRLVDEGTDPTVVFETSGGHATSDTITNDMDVDHDEDGSDGTDDGTAPIMVSTIENLSGSEHTDTLAGDYRANTLDGGDGNDTLDGRGGDDTLTGGAGDDTLNGGDGGDTLNGGDGGDTLNGGDGDDMLNGGAQAENNIPTQTLNGGEGDDIIVALPGDDIDGGTHNATGGTGDVRESVIKPGQDGDVVDYGGWVDPDADEDADPPVPGIGLTSTSLDITDVEIVMGTRYDDVATGAHIIIGREGNDALTGNGAGGTIVGCAGANTLTGATGVDNFGVVKGDAPDVIASFEVETDEIHFKGWAEAEASGSDVRAVATSGGSVLVYVGITLAADVSSSAGDTAANATALAEDLNDNGATACTDDDTESSCFDYSFPVSVMCVSP